jgi:hypothetical protein
VGGKEEPAEQPKKFSRFFGGNTVKKRQRLVMITSNARVLMCAAGTSDKKLKEEVSLLSSGCSWRSFQDSKRLTAWLVETVRQMGSLKHYVGKLTSSSETSSTYSKTPSLLPPIPMAANTPPKNGSTASSKRATTPLRKQCRIPTQLMRRSMICNSYRISLVRRVRWEVTVRLRVLIYPRPGMDI